MCLYKKNISLLLGAGFSAAAGYPLASDVNQKVVNTKNNNFYWSNSGTLVENNPGFKTQYQGYYEVFRKAVEYYLILNQNKMDYEKFYDYLAYDIKKDSSFSKFCYSIQDVDFEQALTHLCSIYNQVILNYIRPSGVRNHQEYDIFREWLSKEKRSKVIHIHTLNHDSFLEQCILHNEYSDGFSNFCSKYYSNNPIQGRTISLPIFRNTYSGHIRVYKLHGSFDQYFCEAGTQRDYVKVPYGYDYANIRDRNGKILNYNFCPEFLTGTTKDQHYDDVFYGKLFAHFKSNLLHSERVIVIGYGGKDVGINKILKNVQKKHKMVYINPHINHSFVNEMHDSGWQIEKIEKSIGQLSLNDLKAE